MLRLSFILFFLLSAPVLRAQGEAALPVLPLREAILEALQANYGLRAEQLNPLIVEQRVTIEDSNFDPSLSANLGYRKRVAAQAASVLDGAAQPRNDNLDAGASLSKTFSPGTQVTAGTGFLRTETNSTNALLNPDYGSELGLEVRQPLWRNAGTEINLAPLRQAKAAVEESQIQFEQTLASLFGDVVASYWQVAAAAQRLALRDSSIELAQTILNKTEQERELGLATRTDILQAQAELAERKESRLQSEQQLADRVDSLRFILGEKLDTGEAPLLTRDLPEPEPPEDPFSEFLMRAASFDPLSRAREEEIRQQEYDIQLAENTARPNLDVVVSGDYLGREDNLSGSYDQALDRSGYFWSAGVELSFPWGLREGKSRKRQAYLQMRQSEIRLEEAHASLRQNLRTAWRRLETGLARLESARATVHLRKEVLISEEARRERGLSQLSDVLEAARQLDDARLREVDAILETVVAHARLYQLDGTIFSRYGFTLDEISTSASSAP